MSKKLDEIAFIVRMGGVRIGKYCVSK